MFNWKIYLEGSECQEERPCRGGHAALHKAVRKLFLGGRKRVSESKNFPFNVFPFPLLCSLYLLTFSHFHASQYSTFHLCCRVFFLIVRCFFFFRFYWPNNVLNCQDAVCPGNFWGQTCTSECRWMHTPVEKISDIFLCLYILIPTYTLWKAQEWKFLTNLTYFTYKLAFERLLIFLALPTPPWDIGSPSLNEMIRAMQVDIKRKNEKLN